jgi:outer membrane protein TolC
MLLGIAALAATLASAGSQAPDPKNSLAQEQLGLARQALSDLDRMVKGGEVSSYDPRFGVWDRRQVEAVRDAGANRAEFLAALEGYMKRLRDRQRLVEEAFRQGQASRLDVHEAKYRVLEAETWLNQEKAR